MDNQKYYWLRWIILLPACASIYIVALEGLTIIFTYMRGIDMEPGEYSLFNLMAPGLAAIIAAFGCIKTGALLAPIYKKQTALILLILISIITGIGIVVLLMKGMDFKLLLIIIGQTVGGFATYTQIERETKEEY